MSAPIRARLLVRLGGVALAGMCIAFFPEAIIALIDVEPAQAATSVRFFHWRVPIDFGLDWLHTYGFGLAAFCWGVVLALRGSRFIERRVVRALPNT